jgi:hypothetical protein
MTEQSNELKTAISLMRMALALLDRTGEQHAGCYLQHAISVAEGEEPLREGQEIDPALIELHWQRGNNGEF